MVEPVIRPATAGDAAGLLALWLELGRTGTAADARYAPRDDVEAIGTGIVAEHWIDQDPARAFVADDAGTLVGFVTRRVPDEHPVLAHRPAVLITDLFVAPSHRRRGLGRALVARAAGDAEVEVGTLARDERAVAFWTSLGFTPWRVTLHRS